MMETIVKIVRGILRIQGATDNTLIGNVGDRLKVDATFQGGNSFESDTNKLHYDDMNASNGGIARGTSVSTTFTNVYYYTGSGYLFGFLVTLEDEEKWHIRLVVDGVDIFLDSTNGIKTGDLGEDDIYGYKFEGAEHRPSGIVLGFSLSKRTVFFEPKFPIRFDSYVSVKIKHESLSKKFKAGLVMIHKD